MADKAEKEIIKKVQYICRHFRIPGQIISCRQITGGHISETYCAALSDGEMEKEYLIQRINTYVYRDPAGLMRNIGLISEHIRKKEWPSDRRHHLHFHHTDSGQNFVILRNGKAIDIKDSEAVSAGWTGSPEDAEEAEFWRVCNYIDHSRTCDAAEENTELLRMAGKAFGRFDRLLRDLDISQVTEIIPHFHDTPYRLQTLFGLAEKDVLHRREKVLPEIGLIREYADFGGSLVRKMEAGELPVHVIHNDTKTSNVLFDQDSLEPLAVIDLDTCMPGLAAYDFGDTIRSAACRPAGENEEEMYLDPELFRAYAEGYLSEMGDVLTRAELASLAPGAAIITLELAARYLSDYLDGSRYLGNADPEQKLRKARRNLSIFRSMMEQMDDMQQIIREESRSFGQTAAGALSPES